MDFGTFIVSVYPVLVFSYPFFPRIFGSPLELFVYWVPVGSLFVTREIRTARQVKVEIDGQTD